MALNKLRASVRNLELSILLCKMVFHVSSRVADDVNLVILDNYLTFPCVFQKNSPMTKVESLNTLELIMMKLFMIYGDRFWKVEKSVISICITGFTFSFI